MTIFLMRAFVRKHRLSLSGLSLLLTVAYMGLAVQDPETATPIGIGYIVIVLAITALIRLYEGEGRGGS